MRPTARRSPMNSMPPMTCPHEVHVLVDRDPGGGEHNVSSRPLRDAIDVMGCLSKFLTSRRGVKAQTGKASLADGSKPLRFCNGGRDHAQRKPWWSQGPQSFSGRDFLHPFPMRDRRRLGCTRRRALISIESFRAQCHSPTLSQAGLVTTPLLARLPRCCRRPTCTARCSR